MTPEGVDESITSSYPTLAVVGSHSISDAVSLLKQGVEDVIARPEPEELVRKAHRLYVSTRRRGRG